MLIFLLTEPGGGRDSNSVHGQLCSHAKLTILLSPTVSFMQNWFTIYTTDNSVALNV